MRSGILEAMALQGMKTFYMEPAECPSGKRMLAFSQHGIQYTRITIEAPAGLIAKQAQGLIESGKANAPSIGGYNNQLQGKIKKLMKSEDYTDFYSNKAAARKDAESYAKAQLVLGMSTKELFQYAPEELTDELRRHRGFQDTDLKKITDAIEATFQMR
jgi:hypothetical protein